MTKKEQQELEKKALDQLLSGDSLFGKEGAFAPMLKGFIEKALQVEMSSHLSTSENNKRNGKGEKTIKSSLGSFEIETPTDRKSDFEPELIKKRQTILADNLSQKIIGLYGLGMSLRDISSHIKQMYDHQYFTHCIESDYRPYYSRYKNMAKSPIRTYILYCLVGRYAL